MSPSQSYIQTYATHTVSQQTHEAASQEPTHQPTQLALFSHNTILNTTLTFCNARCSNINCHFDCQCKGLAHCFSIKCSRVCTAALCNIM